MSVETRFMIETFAKTKLADRPVVWKEAYTKKTLFLKKQYHEVIGPGSYFFNDVEEERNGWKKKSFSRREPMTPSTKERNNSILNRSDFYQQGVMTAYGAMAMPTSSPKARASPGPGYYDGDILRSPSSKSVSNL